MEIIITEHAEKDSRKRLGIPKRALPAMAKRAYLYGKTHSSFVGRMKRYLDGKYLSHQNANNMRVYGEVLYIFCDNRLITLWPLDHDLRGLV